MTSADTLTDWPTNDDLIAEELRADPQFRADWERTALARAVAVAVVRHRAEHDLSLYEGRLCVKGPDKEVFVLPSSRPEGAVRGRGHGRGCCSECSFLYRLVDGSD